MPKAMNVIIRMPIHRLRDEDGGQLAVAFIVSQAFPTKRDSRQLLLALADVNFFLG